MGGVVTIIYPDGTVAEETLDSIPKVGEKIGAFAIARVETKGPDDEVDTGIWIYLQKAEE
ncbi:MAG: hypothetical protein A4E57_01729 [Syntrophorhabdaceae bacterium PtaU1.Bin034]|jgi:hypothetical protein|nr:MAG: hypothetical protein A4E57_01729 [Syntrophorhabdaceae bacterium PtaU1.Bin034]